MSTVDFHTCDKCGREGEVRFDNRGNRRCGFCWERVTSPTFAVNDMDGGTVEGPDPIMPEPEPEPAAPARKGKTK